MININNIKKEIKAKFKDEELYIQLKKLNAIIAGGAITSILTNRRINDFDIYFRNEESIKKIKEYMKQKEYKIISTTDNAITYRKDNYPIIQIITAKELMFNKPIDLIKSFDFTINMAALDLISNELVLEENFIEDNIKRKLIFNEDTKYPITSLARAIKYIDRGYNLSGYEQVKISLAINSLVIKDYKDLKKQLQGIDTSIFAPITDKLIKTEKEYSYQEFKQEMKEIDNENNSNESSRSDSSFI